MIKNDKPAGWAVATWTKRMGGGADMLVLYAATFADKADAVSLVRERFASMPGERTGEAYPLSSLTIEALGMEPGECDML